MATIIFCAYPISGAINASLKIAKDLQNQGHSVFFLGVADCEPLLAENNFEFIPLFEKWFPKGVIGNREDTLRLTGWQGFREARKVTNLFESFFEQLICEDRNEFHTAIKKIRPDLFIIIPSNYYSIVWALLAYEAGVKSIYFNDTLGRSADVLMPPITTDIIPRASLFANLRTSLEWKKFFLRRFLYGKFLSLTGLDVEWDRVIENLANACGYPSAFVDNSDLVAPKLKLPEVVPFPKEFDFPNPEKPGRYYMEASVHLERKQCDFPWQRLDENFPLIYCALGSLIYLSKDEYYNFYRNLLEVARIHNEWQWVFAVGKTLDESDFDDIPSNVIIVQQAPQIDLLKRAYLMITHGGSNSVKECILFGVPMVVFPLGFDQPGIAARVVFHGLGVQGNIRRTSVKKLRSLVETVANHSFYHSQSKMMGRLFQERESSQTGIGIIETILRQ